MIADATQTPVFGRRDPGRARLLRPVRRALRARDARRADRGADRRLPGGARRRAFQRGARRAAARTTSAVRRRSTRRVGWRPRRAARAGVRIFLKREDLTHTGAHKINNALGQALLARRMGKTRIVAETGAGQHGVATATACALLGLECDVYMGAEDMRRQALNVRAHAPARRRRSARSTAGSKTLKDAINEAMRDWVANVHRHALPARLGARAASVSADGPRVPVGDRARGARADPRAGGPAARRRRSPASAAAATPSASSTASSTTRACA